MNKLEINHIEDIQGVIKKARGKFGKAEGFAFALWPDGSLKLIVKGGNYEKTQKRKRKKD
ncbi:hypothetical protein ES703_47296 [subsurface metagenome]